MTDDQSQATGLRRQFIRNVVSPMVAVVLFSFIGCGFTAWWVTTLSNAKALEKQKQVINNIFSQHLSEFLQQHRHLLNWEALPTQLHSPQSAPLSLGSWLYRLAGDDEVYLLDARNRPLAAWLAGKPVSAERYQEVADPLAPWLVQLSTPGAGAAPPFTGDVVRIRQRVAEMAAGVIPAGHGQKLIFIRYLHDSFIDFLEHRGVVSHFRFTPRSPDMPNSAGFTLTSAHKLPVSDVSWQPMRPGSQMLMVTAPLVSLAVLAITLMCMLMTRRLWHSQQRLASSLNRLRASEYHAHQLAMRDGLTGLPNRTAIEAELESRLAALPAERGEFALLLLDLDRFKMINDTYGHQMGDALLINVSQRLASVLAREDVIGRLGGDEFVMVVDLQQGDKSVTRLCQQIITLLTEPVTLQGIHLWVGASLGIALAPQHGRHRLELMRMADIALYAAKSDGRGCYRLYAPPLGKAIQKRQLLAEELCLALDRSDDLALWYQPIMDNSGQKMLGVEALLRWTHPDWGSISPGDFIPVAEETGLILPLGDWVIREACTIAQRCPALTISINVSPLQFLSASFFAHLSATVRQHGISPHQLELEITESVLLGEQQPVLELLRRLRSAGYRIALDDFGTGYSSLNYLMQFPVDTLKIDRSFIELLGIQAQANAIVESVIALGHSLGLRITAEGVETESQRLALAAAGCDKLQGFLLSPPQPVEKLFLMLEQPSLLPSPRADRV